jgi:hypothetical protein
MPVRVCSHVLLTTPHQLTVWFVDFRLRRTAILGKL